MTKLDWIMHPVVQYGLLAGGLCLCLYLFVTAKMEIRAARTKWKAAEATLADAISAVRASLDVVRADIHEMREQTGMLVAPAPARSGLNLNKRGQALQLSRRGQSSEQIASTLGLPVTEVDLLVKVHQIVLDQVR